MVGRRLPTHQRFTEKFSKGTPTSCWEWQAGTNGVGYGLLWNLESHRKVLAHRYSYEFHVGPIPSGLLVLHKCDNPPCVNPKHLFLGTFSDNSRDMVKKGRHRYVGNPNNKPPIFRGSDHYLAKLTEDDVLDIYQLRISGMAIRAIARKYKMERTTIASICKGTGWPHVLKDPRAPTIEQLLALPAAKAQTKLQPDDIPGIRQLLADGLTNSQIGARYNVHHRTIADIKSGRSWAAH